MANDHTAARCHSETTQPSALDSLAFSATLVGFGRGQASGAGRRGRAPPSVRPRLPRGVTHTHSGTGALDCGPPSPPQETRSKLARPACSRRERNCVARRRHPDRPERPRHRPHVRTPGYPTLVTIDA